MEFIRSSIFSMTSRILTLVTGFGTFFLLVRIYNQTDFGIWALFLTISTIVEMARNGLVRSSLIRFFNSDREELKPLIFGISCWLNLLYTLSSFLLLLAISPLVAIKLDYPDFISVVLNYGLSTFLLIPLTQLQFYQHAHLDFKSVLISTFVRQFTFFSSVLILYFYNFHISVSSLILIQGAGIFAATLTALYLSRNKLKVQWRLDIEWLKKQFKFGKFVLGTNISSLIFKGLDQLMLSFMISPQAGAIYSVAIRVTNLIEYPATSVSEVAFPSAIRKVALGGIVEIPKIYNQSVGLILCIITPLIIATFFLSDMLVPLIAGSAYAYSAHVLKLTMIFGFITPFNRQFGMVLDAMDMPQLNFKILLLAVGINLVSNYVFIAHFGIIGAAYGTLTSYIVVFIINQFVLSRIIDLNPVHSFVYAFKFSRSGFLYFINKF